MSAPSESGCCNAGEAKVLSTTESTSWRCARAARAAMSLIFMSGLLGVSTHSSFVRPGMIAASTAARSPRSTTVCSIPQAPCTRLISR